MKESVEPESTRVGNLRRAEIGSAGAAESDNENSVVNEITRERSMEERADALRYNSPGEVRT